MFRRRKISSSNSSKGTTALFVLGILGALMSLLGTAHGIQCHRCISTNSSRPFLCNEFLTDDIMEPESCDDVYDAQYCIKHVGRFEGGIGTKRFCSSVNLGNYCDEVQQPGDQLTYRTCVYTCDSDGCNPASTISPSSQLNILQFSAMLVVLGSFYSLR